MKCLHSPNKVDFKNEVEMLKMFSDNAHPHLISLLATYEQFGVYYLIFPRADRDLNSFWKDENPRPSCDAKTIRWVAKQCMGIAQGLAKIHEYQTSDPNHASGVHEKKHVRHGDIKPENILWFSDDDGGILKISDFGLSESTNFSHSYKPNLQVAGASQSYRPPECDVRGAFVGRSWDIWTLGCLYLEFVTWLLGGWGLVAVFNNKRLSPDRFRYGWRTDTFFELFRNDNDKEGNSIGARVKPSVTQVCSIRLSCLASVPLTLVTTSS